MRILQKALAAVKTSNNKVVKFNLTQSGRGDKGNSHMIKGLQQVQQRMKANIVESCSNAHRLSVSILVRRWYLFLDVAERGGIGPRVYSDDVFLDMPSAKSD